MSHINKFGQTSDSNPGSLNKIKLKHFINKYNKHIEMNITKIEKEIRIIKSEINSLNTTIDEDVDQNIQQIQQTYKEFSDKFLQLYIKPIEKKLQNIEDILFQIVTNKNNDSDSSVSKVKINFPLIKAITKQ